MIARRYRMNEAEKQKINTFYKSVNEMMAHLNAEGEIDTESSLVCDVMDALYEIDEGVYDEKRFNKFMNELIANKN